MIVEGGVKMTCTPAADRAVERPLGRVAVRRVVGGHPVVHADGDRRVELDDEVT